LTQQIQKQKSKKLEKLIANLVPDFGKLETKVNAIFEQGRKESFGDKEIGDMIRSKMKEYHSDRAIRRVYHSNEEPYHNIKGRSTLFKSVVEDTAVQCSECFQVVIAEYNLGTRRIAVFEYDPYIAKQQQKTLHPHPAGPIMTKRVTTRIAVERRLLHSFDENDFHVLTKGGDIY
jgi:hypothetical protein